MNEKVKLENIKTKIETNEEYTYLYLKGEFKNKTTGEVQIIKVPKICLNELISIKRDRIRGLYDDSEKFKVTLNYPPTYFNNIDIFHTVEFALYPDSKGDFVTLENQPKEMTKEEIEKELGYKIKIV